MPAGSIALTPIAAANGPAGSAYTETDINATSGNKFVNDGSTILTLRNTTLSAISVDFYVDTPEGNEVKEMTVSIPGSGTADGLKRLGPFQPSRYNNHHATEAASAGSVILKPATGSTGDLKACVEPLARGLFLG